jgi:glycerol-3-phosphate acyltransferase PlsY
MITLGLVIVVSYLVGAIPWSLVVARAVGGADPRTVGSGNLGATNTFRALGWRAGVVVMVLDIAKGWIAPVGLARLHVDAPPCSRATLAVVAAVAAIVGHIFPVYTRFHGGKGIATTTGAFLGLEPAACAIAIAAFACGLLLTRGIVSVGSLSGATALPIAVFALGQRHGGASALYLGVALALSVLIWVKHASNLGRLLRGEERSVFARGDRAQARRPTS